MTLASLENHVAPASPDPVPERLVAPWGFYGCGNIGDEATLQGFGRLVSGHGLTIRASVASRDPRHTARIAPGLRHFRAVGLDPRRWWAFRHASGAVVPGGTPIMDVLGKWPLAELAPLVEDMHRRGLPVIFVGTGTERLYRDASRKLVGERIAPHVLHWSVRCHRDRERLTEYGVPPGQITVAGDLAWLLDAADPSFGRAQLRRWGVDPDTPLLGVNVNGERFVLEREPRFFDKVAALLDAVVESREIRVLFFCNEIREGETFDKAASEQVRARMAHRERAFIVPNRYWSPQEMLSLIGSCQATVGIRLHFCLFSALQRVPFLALQRSDKVADLCWDMGWPHGVGLDALDLPVLERAVVTLLDNRQQLVTQLDGAVTVMRSKASLNSVPLDSLRRASAA
jgi:polysaccharide pyruvyl transferase WcaK-like protein